MAKSWKTLIKTTDSDSQNNTNSWNNFQLTLDEIASQNEALNDLLKERQSLEGEMDGLLQSANPATEDPRFASSIESFKNKREKEKKRVALKKKLEERILRKSKELEKWEENQERLKEKLNLQRKLLRKKETDQGPSTGPKAQKSTEKSSEKNWFDTNDIRKKKDVIEKKKEVLTESIRKVKNTSEKVKSVKKTLDTFGLRDLAKVQKKSDPENPEKQKKKPLELPVRIQKIKDDWNEKRVNKQEELKEKLSLKKLSDKLQEMKRFDPLSKLDEPIPDEFSKLKVLTKDLDKKLNLDERLDNGAEKASSKLAEKKEDEKKETNRREKLKEKILSQKRDERKEEERSSRKKERKNEKYN